MACVRCKRNLERLEMGAPTHRERQLMQHLRGGGWVKASVAPGGEKLIENLLAKGGSNGAVLETNYPIGSRTKASRARRRKVRFMVDRRLVERGCREWKSKRP